MIASAAAMGFELSPAAKVALSSKAFPGLQDKLSAFPAATIYNRIIRDWASLRPQLKLFSKPALQRRIETLYGSYVVALSKGAAPYQLADREPKFKTVSFMVEQTGIDRQTVVAFLSTLEKMAKAGEIDLKYWNPDRATQQNKEIQRRQKIDAATAPKSPIIAAVQEGASAVKWGGIGLVALVGAFAVSKLVR
jgi:hypothetical protein